MPERPVLLVQRDEVARGRRARVAPGIVEEHQREEAKHLRPVRQQRVEQPREADRLRAQAGTHKLVAGSRGVALVEDQIDHGKHGCEALRERLGRRDAVRYTRVADLALHAHEPLRHRRLGDEEGAGDLGGREATERAQCERNLRFGRDGGVATREDEAQTVVDDVATLRGLLGEALLALQQRAEGLQLAGEALVATDAVDGAIACGGGQPGGRVLRHALARPVLERPREGVLQGVLREVEVAAGADQRGEDRAAFRSEDGVDRLAGGGGRRILAHLISASGAASRRCPALRRRRSSP